MTRSRRTILCLALATFLLMAPWASAAPQSAAGPRTVLAQLWSFLTWVWAPVSPDIGCSYDPNGIHCASPTGDYGCMVDPDGRHCPGGSATPTGDTGCSYDPDGRCHLGG